MNPHPDPEFDGQKAWLLFLSNLCVIGGMQHYEMQTLVHRETIEKPIPFSYFELHTDTVHCLVCNKKLGMLIEDVPDKPRVCNTHHAESFNVTHNLLEAGKLLGFKSPVRAYNYLLEHNLKLRKGSWHNLSPKN